MADCEKCGKTLEEGVETCPDCKEEVTENVETKEQETAKTEDIADKIANLNETPDITAEMDPKDIEDNKIMAVLAYIGLLFLVPLFAAKESKFARFHTNQGLVLYLLGIAGVVVNIIPILGQIASFVVVIAQIVFMILGIINAAQGKAKELPIIGKIKLLK